MDEGEDTSHDWSIVDNPISTGEHHETSTDASIEASIESEASHFELVGHHNDDTEVSRATGSNSCEGSSNSTVLVETDPIEIYQAGKRKATAGPGSGGSSVDETMGCKFSKKNLNSHQAAALGKLDVLKEIAGTQSRSELFKIDSIGWRPIHYAAYHGHADVLEYLLENGAKVNERTNFNRGGNALYWAMKEPQKHTKAIAVLEKYSGDVIPPLFSMNNQTSSTRTNKDVGEGVQTKEAPEEDTAPIDLDRDNIVKQILESDRKLPAKTNRSDSPTTSAAAKGIRDLSLEDFPLTANVFEPKSNRSESPTYSLGDISMVSDILDGDKKMPAVNTCSATQSTSSAAKGIEALSLDDNPSSSGVVADNRFPLDGRWKTLWYSQTEEYSQTENTTIIEVKNHIFEMMGCPCFIKRSESSGPLGSYRASFKWPEVLSEYPIYQEAKRAIYPGDVSIEWSTTDEEYGDSVWFRLDPEETKTGTEKKQNTKRGTVYPLDGTWQLKWSSYCLDESLITVSEHKFKFFDCPCEIVLKPEDNFCPSVKWPTAIFSEETPIFQNGKHSIPEDLDVWPSVVEWTITDKQYGEVTWTRLDSGDSAASYINDKKRKELDEDETQNRRHEEEKRMKSSIPGKAWDLAKGIIALSKTIEDVSIIAEDDVVYLAERLLSAQSGFKERNLHWTVDIAYHHTQSINLATIRTNGLLTLKERNARHIESPHNGSAAGDGIYCSEDPIRYADSQRYGDTTIVLARMKGSVSVDVDRNCDTILRPGFCVLQNCNQCIPLFQFASRLLGRRYPCSDSNMQASIVCFREKLAVFQKVVQGLLDQIINDNICSQVDITWAVRYNDEVMMTEIENCNSTAELQHVISTDVAPRFQAAAKKRYLKIAPDLYPSFMRMMPPEYPRRAPTTDFPPQQSNPSPQQAGYQQTQSSNLPLGQQNQLFVQQNLHRVNASRPPWARENLSTGQSSNQQAQSSILNRVPGESDEVFLIGQSQSLILDLEAIENDLDTRTTLIVQNIPHKYTKKTLLDEFTISNHGPGIIDFFYLPSDSKDGCNRGYAIINFVRYRDIVRFHRQYSGQPWSTFNLDKTCDVTFHLEKICDMKYARIQGKAAILNHFEKSAFWEKDEEYRPSVFVSSGPESGKRLPFPEPMVQREHSDKSFLTLSYSAPESLTTRTGQEYFYKSTLTHKEACSKCPICGDPLRTRGKIVEISYCGHIFHEACLQKSMKFKLQASCTVCSLPICEYRWGGKIPSGTMIISKIDSHCDGFEEFATYAIEYMIPSGLQKEYHPNQQQPFSSDGKFTTFFPASPSGIQLLERLKFAFIHGLTFLVGPCNSVVPEVTLQTTLVHDPSYIAKCNIDLDRLQVPSALKLFLERSISDSVHADLSIYNFEFPATWQTDEDHSDRREMRFHVFKLLKTMIPEGSDFRIGFKLNRVAKNLEEHLYQNSSSKAAYIDTETLKFRLQQLGFGVFLTNK